ncbi:MAG: hypothetical protein IIB56_16565 [Planctomycetes bacterium]|nr:hypothetical protein [Planctomycetota bacterium]
MKIIASADIGELGQKEGTAVVYNWRWYYSIPGLALWVVLIAAFIFIKANRNPQALLILAPLLILNLLWLAFKKVMVLGSADIEMFSMVFNSLVVSITVLWLFAHKLGNRNRFVTFLLALALMAVLGLIGAISYCGLTFSQQTVGALILLAMSALAMLLGFVLAGWQCRNRYSGLRFVLYLALWTIVTCLASTLVIYSTVFIIQQTPIPIFTVLLMVSIVGLILGACLYVINLPFIILAFRSPFFRERFYACLRLKSMPSTIRQVDVDQPGEQNPNPKTSENSSSV